LWIYDLLGREEPGGPDVDEALARGTTESGWREKDKTE
jgi:hypothetical protein